MRRYYGFLLSPDGNAETHPTESAAVKLIYSEYMNGLSLGRIAESLQQHGYLSPTGGQIWNRSSIDNILKKGYYAGRIVTFEEFTAAQFEREFRTNINEDTGKRKTTRYHSKNELSGLLLCVECGAPYRRITRHSGEVVWRCATIEWSMEKRYVKQRRP